MELIFPHAVEYKSAKASIDEAIENLKAQKALIDEAVKFLDRAIPEMTLSDAHITVVKVAAGSLITELLIKLHGSYQKNIDDFIVSGVESMLGKDIPQEYEALVTFAVLAVVYFVARYAYDAVMRKKEIKPTSIHIEGNYNTVITTLSDKVNISVEDLDAAMQAGLPASRRRGLIKSVTKFLRPSSDGTSGPVTVKGVGDIPDGVFSEYPSDSDLADIDDSKNIDLPNVTLDIRAVDRDKNNAGWAAVIVGSEHFKSRLPMELYPTVDASVLAKKETVVADVIISGNRRPDGGFKAKKIHLLTIRD